MTPECQEWARRAVAVYPMRGDVLEVGSFDVNGSPRGTFADRERFPNYTGIDMRPGPAVDRVMNVQHLEFPDENFDVVIDMERLEHDDKFWLSCAECFRVLRPGGYIIVTTRSWNAFPPHDYPSDYWRFMDNGLRILLESTGFKVVDLAYAENCQAIFAIGQKP